MDLQTAIISLRLGPIKGIQRISYLGNRFYSFRGIPYAQPPIGKLRFRVEYKSYTFLFYVLSINK